MFSREPKPPKTDDTGASDWRARLKAGLARTGDRLKEAANVFRAAPKIDEALYESLETTLIASDVGTVATQRLIEELRRAVKAKRLEDASARTSSASSHLTSRPIWII